MMACLAVLIRYKIWMMIDILIMLMIRSTPEYKDNYEWFVELAKNFHWIQSKMVESVDKASAEKKENKISNIIRIKLK